MKRITTNNFEHFSPENEKKHINLGLNRIKEALIKLNNPCKNVPAIQIIGTNGKGSITAFLENIISSSHINVGVTTSPHLFNITERIRVNKVNIENHRLEELLNNIQLKLQKFNLSPFELLICSGLKYFDSKKVDLLILEAGLGGRLDATTAHKKRPIIAIGRIGIDHCEYLGDSIEKITREKLAVIEKGSFVVSCAQDEKVENIINEKIEEIGATITWVTPLSEKWKLGLNGYFQRQNAAVAIEVAKSLRMQGWFINDRIIYKSLSETKWPGRLELVKWKKNRILVDAAHNPLAASVLADERINWLNETKGIFWILGVQKQKNISLIIKNLIKPIDKLIIVPVPNQESWTLNEILENSNVKVNNMMEFQDFKEALEELEKLNVWPQSVPVLTGSIFLVSEFLKFAETMS